MERDNNLECKVIVEDLKIKEKSNEKSESVEKLKI